jgi:hypothetical protein
MSYPLTYMITELIVLKRPITKPGGLLGLKKSKFDLSLLYNHSLFCCMPETLHDPSLR